MDKFSALDLPTPLLQALDKMGFAQPTPIQAAAIPLALAGRDILGSAQTGTGKTAAFAVPLIARLLAHKQSSALVLSPTRELAAQIIKEMHKFLSCTQQIRTALLIGGDSMGKQLAQLRQFPRLLVGTPGRVNDHLQQGTLRLELCDILVLDETDKMLDMGFEQQIDRIVKRLPKKRQTLMFSATLPPHIVKLSQKYTHNAERIAVGSIHTPIERITQEIVHIAHPDKYEALKAQLQARKGSVIVFVKTKHGADKLARKLNTDKFGAEAIHGNLNQNKRTRVIAAFRDKKHRILVATDVAARGLDIPHIEHVINYDLPQVAEDYIHRIGRTARAGAAGSALCFISPEDREKWHEIQKLMNPGAKIEKPAHSHSSRPQQKSGEGRRHKAGRQESHKGGRFDASASRRRRSRNRRAKSGGHAHASGPKR